MKKPLLIPVALLTGLLSLSFVDIHRADGVLTPAEVTAEKQSVTWYLIARDNSPDLAGRSAKTPDEVAGVLNRGEFLRLDECRELDAQGRWSPLGGTKVSGTIHVRPTLVRSFQELTGDPLSRDADP